MSLDETVTDDHRLFPKEIPISLVDDNPFNSRMDYSEEDAEQLMCSLAQVGLLTPVRVREKNGRYQLVYGHRRLRAAKALHWATIRAELCDLSDEEMCRRSLIENAVRDDLSDYEKAVTFARLNREFGKTCEEIGRELGLSKQHINNYIKMVNLFDEATLSRDAYLRLAMRRITEHHARVLGRITDDQARADALKLVVLENFSVRDLERTLRHLRTWFSTRHPRRSLIRNDTSACSSHLSDIGEINRVLLNEFSLPDKGDFKSFVESHSFEAGYSIFSYFPPMQRRENHDALKKEREWFTSVAPNFAIELHDVSVQFYDNVAVVTLYVDYQDRHDKQKTLFRTRGSLIFAYKRRKWKIVHEHFSLLDSKAVSVTTIPNYSPSNRSFSRF